MLVGRIKEDLTLAMKNGDKEKLSALRLLKADITNKSKELKIAEDTITDEVAIGLTKKLVNRYREELEWNEKEAASINNCIEFLSTYLPIQLSAKELGAIISEVVAEGSSFGLIMKAVKERVAGRADMGVAAKMVKEALGR